MLIRKTIEYFCQTPVVSPTSPPPPPSGLTLIGALFVMNRIPRGPRASITTGSLSQLSFSIPSLVTQTINCMGSYHHVTVVNLI